MDRLGLSVKDVAAYASQHGWRPVPHPNQRLMVFVGPLDDFGKPIYLVLTSHDEFRDAPLRWAESINLLANVELRSPTAILAEIQKTNSNA